MPLGLALTGLTHNKNGKELWALDTVSWWDELELIQDPRFKKLDLGSNKIVHEAVLEVHEILKLHNQYKKNFLEVFEEDILTKPYHRQRQQLVDDLEGKLSNPDLRYVSVWVFDWDY